MASANDLIAVFVALVAPHLFRDNWELPLGIVAVIAMMLVVAWRDPKSHIYHGKSKLLTAVELRGAYYAETAQVSSSGSLVVQAG